MKKRSPNNESIRLPGHASIRSGDRIREGWQKMTLLSSGLETAPPSCQGGKDEC